MSPRTALTAHEAPGRTLRGRTGGQLDTAAPGPPRRPGRPARSSTAPPPSTPAEAPAKPPAGHRRSHRQFTGVFREITGPGPCTLLRRHRPRLFTANKAPSGPQLPRSAPRPRSAGPVAGHFSGDSPGVHRETAGPDLDPPTRRAPAYLRGSRSVSRVPSRSATPPPAELRRRLRDGHRRFTGGSPGPHRPQLARPPGPHARPHLRGRCGVSRVPNDPRYPPNRGSAGPARGISPATYRRFTGASPGKTRPEHHAVSPSTRPQDHAAPSSDRSEKTPSHGLRGRREAPRRITLRGTLCAPAARLTALAEDLLSLIHISEPTRPY